MNKKVIIVLALVSMAMAGEVKADEDSAYDENPNNDVSAEDLSPAQQKFYEVSGYMMAGAIAVMLINSFQANRDKKRKENLEKYQRDELEKFEKKFAAGRTKWNTTSQKTKDQAGGLN
jgi:hypothetical protein